MKRIIRKKRLTAKQAANYNKIRQQIKEELPDLIARHAEKTAKNQTCSKK